MLIYLLLNWETGHSTWRWWCIGHWISMLRPSQTGQWRRVLRDVGKRWSVNRKRMLTGDVSERLCEQRAWEPGKQSVMDIGTDLFSTLQCAYMCSRATGSRLFGWREDCEEYSQHQHQNVPRWGRQSLGPTAIDEKEHGGSYDCCLITPNPSATVNTMDCHLPHSTQHDSLLRSGTDIHPQHGVSPAPWDWAMWLPGLGNHLFWKLPDVITGCILWAAEVQTIKLEETQAISISTFGLLCPNSFLWSDNIWGSWFLIFNCSC